jgi:hypothetical protein
MLVKGLPKKKENIFRIWALTLLTSTSWIRTLQLKVLLTETKERPHATEQMACHCEGMGSAATLEQSQKHAHGMRLSRSSWSCGSSCLGGRLQTLVLETFPTCEGTRKDIYWETNKQTNQCGFMVFKINTLMS